MSITIIGIIAHIISFPLNFFEKSLVLYIKYIFYIWVIFLNIFAIYNTLDVRLIKIIFSLFGAFSPFLIFGWILVVSPYLIFLSIPWIYECLIKDNTILFEAFIQFARMPVRALLKSAGVRYSKYLLDWTFNHFAAFLSFSSVTLRKPIPLRKYCHQRLLPFSSAPCRHGYVACKTRDIRYLPFGEAQTNSALCRTTCAFLTSTMMLKQASTTTGTGTTIRSWKGIVHPIPLALKGTKSLCPRKQWSSELKRSWVPGSI